MLKEISVFIVVVVLMVGITGVALNVVGGLEYDSTEEYTVRNGDTIWGIASNANPNSRYNVNEIVFEIKDINDIDSTINAGDVIEVPVLEGGE